jgi:hypothetical protein
MGNVFYLQKSLVARCSQNQGVKYLGTTDVPATQEGDSDEKQESKEGAESKETTE